MDDAPDKRAADILPAEIKIVNAWQPFTPRGVAAFAQAPGSRVFFLKAVAALVAAAIVIWFINANYSPSISEAIKNLPDEASFQNGELTNVSSGVLTQKKFLSLVVDLEENGQTGQTADLQVVLRKNYFEICSLPGCGYFKYPNENILIGRSTSEPWWGARQPVILAIIGALSLAGLWLAWVIFALVYAPIAKLTAYFNDRPLSWRGSWRLASAAQMPGAFLMSLAIVLYGLHVFDLIRFIFFFGLHFFVTWFYIFSAPFSLPRASAASSSPAKNPFGQE